MALPPVEIPLKSRRTRSPLLLVCRPAACFPGQELGVALDVHLKAGWHVYGKPLPGTYQAIELAFEGPLVGEQSLEMPSAKPLLLKALGETLPVYESEIRAIGKLGISWSPPMPAKFLEALGPRIEPGLHSIRGVLRFQACSDEVCEIPQTVEFKLPLKIEPGIPVCTQTAGIAKSEVDYANCR